MEKIKSKDTYMFLIENSGYWASLEGDNDEWYVLHGSHYIEPLDGNYVNYHHNNQPSFVDKIENGLKVTEDEFWRLIDVMFIPREAQVEMLGSTIYSLNEKETEDMLKNSADAICYCFAELIENKTFERNILLKNHPNGNPIYLKHKSQKE